MAATRRRYANDDLLAESRPEMRFAPVPTADGDGRKFPRFYFRTLATATIHPVPKRAENINEIRSLVAG